LFEWEKERNLQTKEANDKRLAEMKSNMSRSNRGGGSVLLQMIGGFILALLLL